jgi:hypothetical protein
VELDIHLPREIPREKVVVGVPVGVSWGEVLLNLGQHLGERDSLRELRGEALGCC